MVDRQRVEEALRRYYRNQQHCVVGRVLGQGGFGTVFAGWQPSLGRDVAIKAVVADGVDFSAEARLLAQLNHPHIVPIFDYFEDDELHVIIMEQLPQGSLTHRMQEHGQPDACAVALAQSEALAHAHARNILHRDIKPENTLFDALNVPKVTDLGLAKIFAGSTMASRVAGTPGYLAPEQLWRGELSPATDVFAIGVCLYEGLSGNLPYENNRGNAGSPGQPEPLPASVPTGVAEVVLRAVQIPVGSRQATAREFALDLAAAAGRGYGYRWISNSAVKLRLDEEVYEAATRPPSQR